MVDGSRMNEMITDNLSGDEWNMATSRLIMHLNKGQRVYPENTVNGVINIHGLYTVFNGYLIKAD